MKSLSCRDELPNAASDWATFFADLSSLLQPYLSETAPFNPSNGDMHVMWKAISFIQKKLVWSIPVSMIAGILVGATTNADPLKALIIPLTFLMVYPMMINLQLQKIALG